MVINVGIVSNFKKLEEIISHTKPEEILETLKSRANYLYENRGNLDTWDNKKLPERKKIWHAQEELVHLWLVLFKKEQSDKLKKIYSVITEKNPVGVDYSLFYNQLHDAILDVAAHIYGKNMIVQNGVEMDFAHYTRNIAYLKQILETGPRDSFEGELHKGVLKKHEMEVSNPPS